MIYNIIVFFWNLYLYLKNKFYFKLNYTKVRLYKRWKRSREGYKLTFMDDFNTNEIKKYWRTDSYTGQRFDENSLNEKHIEFYSDNCFDFNSTTVMIQSKKLPKNLKIDNSVYHADVHIGQLDSSLYFMQTEGYFEFRVKLPKANNIKSSIKLHSLLTGSEISIIDYKGINSNKKYSVGVNGNYMNVYTPFDLSSRFFIYALKWDNRFLKFYFQDKLVKAIKKPKDIFHPMHIILKNGINSKSIDGVEFPNSFDIDYVRVYEEKENK